MYTIAIATVDAPSNVVRMDVDAHKSVHVVDAKSLSRDPIAGAGRED